MLSRKTGSRSRSDSCRPISSAGRLRRHRHACAAPHRRPPAGSPAAGRSSSATRFIAAGLPSSVQAMRTRRTSDGPSVQPMHANAPAGPCGVGNSQAISTPGCTLPVLHPPARAAATASSPAPSACTTACGPCSMTRRVTDSGRARRRAPGRAPGSAAAASISAAASSGRTPRASGPRSAAALDLLQPGRRRRHAARRLRPAQAVVDDLLGVLGQVVEQRPGQRRRLRAPPTTGSSAGRRSAARAPRTASARPRRPAACSVTCSVQACRARPPARAAAPVTEAVTSRLVRARLADQQQHAGRVDGRRCPAPAR